MNNFNFKRRSLVSGLHLLGALLIVAELFAWASLVFFESASSTEHVLGVRAGAILLGLVIISVYGGTLIGFAERGSKEYLSIGDWKFGD